MLRKDGVGNPNIDLIVHVQGPVVEIRRADDAPRPVDDRRLGVHHRRLVLVDLDPLPEQRVVFAAARPLHRFRVRTVTFDQYPDAHTAAARLLEGPTGGIVDDEVRRGDLERSLRGANSK
jgi:hypothetical protein